MEVNSASVFKFSPLLLDRHVQREKFLTYATFISMMPTIQDGDYVFIVYDKRRQWIRKVKKDTQFHCDKGFLNFSDIIGEEYGHTVLLKPNRNKVALLPPSLSDTIYHMKRESQIIYPEDIGLILAFSDLRTGGRVIEAGTGSGTVSSLMAKLVMPTGNIRTFDVREQALFQAKENIRKLGAADIVEANLGNILEDAMDIQGINFIMLDLATTWLAVPKVVPMLAEGGRICLFSPSIEQVRKNVKFLQDLQMHEVVSVELLHRTFQVKPNATRPNGRMIGHTGYLTFASKNSDPNRFNIFTAHYTPENVGNLLLYGNLFPGSKILLVTTHSSPLFEILASRFGDNVNIETIMIPPNFAPSDTEAAFLSLEQIARLDQVVQGGLFSTVVLDGVITETIVEELDTYLQPGYIMAGIHASIEDMKQHYLQMERLHYYELGASELIKREIVVDLQRKRSHSAPMNSTGYITFGRKVIDPHRNVEEKPKEKIEFVENFLDVGTGLGDLPDEEEEKIDYANLDGDY